MSKYACQQYTPPSPCRYDRRAIDRKCDGCQRETDAEYLQSQGLWVVGVSHTLSAEHVQSIE